MKRVTIPLLLLLTLSVAMADESSRTFLADLTPEARQALPAGIEKESPEVQLQAVFEAESSYRFEQGVLTAFSDRRWFSTYTAGSSESAILELRRWPGDTRFLIYAVAGPLSAIRGVTPPIPNALLSVHEGANEHWAEWSGTIETEIGDRPVVWIEQDIVPGSPAFLGALLMPGDAGLGAAAAADLLQEMRVLFDRVLIRGELWKRRKGLPHDQLVELGDTFTVPSAKAESVHPWQVVKGSDFTLGVPPGVRARRLDGDVPPPIQIEGGKIWLRGRYTDIDGQGVVIGDAEHVGYVAQVDATEAWTEGRVAPVGIPGAKNVAGAGFPLLKEKERSAADSGRAERWQQPGFAGQWLVFRLAFPDRGIEVALPVLEGRRSASLFWIPASYRGPGRSPAEPPVDPAERFGIKWERLTRGDQLRKPWMEGHLTMPGIKVELPKHWWPSASVRSLDGYPIRLVHQDSAVMGRIFRLEPDEIAEVLGGEGSGWVESPRPAVHRAERAWSRDGGLLYLAKEGHAYRFELASPDRVTDEEWARMAESIQLVRSEQP